MKKLAYFNMLLVLLMLCGCGDTNLGTAYVSEHGTKDTQFIFDTFVTLSADCDEQVLEGAFELCRYYEKLLSRMVKDSDVAALNSSEGFYEVSGETAAIINRALYFGNVSGGRFDISICPLSSLWDFNNEVIPSRDEISEALKNIDYQEIKVNNNNNIALNGKKIDLGGIAKGYIADRLIEYFKNEGIKSATVSLGGNIARIGENDTAIGIKKPFSDGEYSGIYHTKGEEISVVTSGVYERCFEKGGRLYHHILDPKTGYPVDSDLSSATIISKCSMDADALSTVCILLGLERAAELIEKTEGTEAIFISREGKISYTSGIYREDTDFYKK